MKNTILWLPLIVLIMQSCIAPRSVTNSGKVTPKNNIAVGVNYVGNVSTAPIKEIKNIIQDNIEQIPALIDAGSDTSTLSADSILWLNRNLENIGRGAIAYAADPLGSSMEIYLRYGIADRVDIGYKFNGMAHSFDAQYQFMGTLGNINDAAYDGWYGSVGLQFSTQNVSIPAWLTVLENTIDFNFKRKDFMMPVIFSKSFGKEEEYGALSMGAVVNYTLLNYSTLNADFVTFVDESGEIESLNIRSLNSKQDILAFGGFMNLKIGYKYVYLLPSLTFYYQNYGRFNNIIGSDFNLRGFTFIPSLGLRLRLGKE